LEKVVQKRTAELDLRNRDMRLVLDNVQQGFLTIDLDGVMSPERSAVIATWLGTADPGTTFADYLGRHAPHTADMFRGAWDQVVGGVLPPDVSLDQMPKKASVGERHLELEYIPICEGDELKKTLVVLSDVTVEVQRERLEAEQREVLHMFERALNDKSGFLEFFEESALQVNAIVSGEVEDTVVLKRIIHTLKGNSSIFGVTTVANLCHRMEAELAEEGQPPTAAQRNELSERWKALRVKVDTLLGENARRKIEVDDAECEQILDAISSGSPRPVIAKLISDWRLEPTSRRLRRIAEQARGIASRLEKGPIAVDFDAGDLRLDPELWTPFWSAFVHVVRNAIDHGIETADERRAADKPPEGVLGLTTRMESGQFVIEIRDDGRGVDWQAIKERAEERGLRAETEADLVEALFSDGISTRKIMSEYSGRGIGMGAVRAACAELGGAVSIHSTAGAGTRVEFTFPRTAMSAARRAQLVA
ncbi:MAG TPA: ATP-binding protein, partial [Polyangiaceae bacterium]